MFDAYISTLGGSFNFLHKFLSHERGRSNQILGVIQDQQQGGGANGAGKGVGILAWLQPPREGDAVEQYLHLGDAVQIQPQGPLETRRRGLHEPMGDGQRHLGLADAGQSSDGEQTGSLQVGHAPRHIRVASPEIIRSERLSS